MTAPTSWLWAVPFLGLLLTFAGAPLLAPPLWHRHYPWWTALWSLAHQDVPMDPSLNEEGSCRARSSTGKGDDERRRQAALGGGATASWGEPKGMRFLHEAHHVGATIDM
jgi:hypothetical protein